MKHENNNIGGRAEHPGSDEQKISELLGTLKRVEAPKDFDFHLKARIAAARPSDYQRTRLIPILKYVMPLALFLVVGAGMFVVNSFNSTVDPDIVSQPSTPVVTIPVPAATAESAAVQPPAYSAPEQPRILTTANPEAVRRTPRPEAPRSSPDRNTPEGGSRDFTTPSNSALKALTVAPTPRTPAGLSLNPKRLDEAFRMIDAEAEFEIGHWVVKSIKSNGIADQMGLRTGDKVRAINGTPVSERAEFPAAFNARTIQVERGGETVELGGAKMPE